MAGEILSLKFKIGGQTKNCYFFELQTDLGDTVFFPKKVYIDRKILIEPKKEITMVIK